MTMLQPEMHLDAREKSAGMGFRFWQATSVLAGAIAVYKGLRIPNRWSATQAQIDYSLGIVKRGFFGAVFGHAFHLNHYRNFAVLSFLLLALLLAATVLFVKASIDRSAWEVAAVFAGSYSVTMLASTIGYFDILLASLAILSLLMPTQTTRIAVALPLSVVAMLVHEIYLLVFLPILLLQFVLEAIAGSTARERRIGAASVVVLALLCGAISIRLAARPPMTELQLQEMIAHIGNNVDFLPRDDFYAVMIRSGHDNFSFMRSVMFRLSWWRMLQLQGLLLFGPVFAFLGWVAFTLSRAQRKISAPLLFAMLTVCACSPLLLHLIAWDVSRFDGLACFSYFLAILVCMRFFGAGTLSISAKRQAVAVCVLLLSMASGGMQMRREDRVFPDVVGARATLWQFRHWTLAHMANTSD